MTFSSLRMTAAMVALATVVVVATFVVDANPSSSVVAESPSTWVSSAGVDAATRIGPGGSDVTVSLGDVGGHLQIVELDGVAYTVDGAGTLARIDPATLEVEVGVSLPGTELVAGGERMYAVDRGRGTATELDPATLGVLTAPIPVAESLGAAVVDDAGVLWAIDEATGEAVRLDRETELSRVAVIEPGVAGRLTVVDGAVTVADPDAASLQVMDTTGTSVSTIELGELSGADVHVPESVSAGTIVPIVDGDRLLLVDVRRGTVAVVTLDGAGPRLGKPVVAAGVAFVPDLDGASLEAVDLTTSQRRAPLKLDGVGSDFDVIAKGDFTYVNDPGTERAWVVGPDGSIVPIDKYDPNDPGGGAVVPVVPPGVEVLTDGRDDGSEDEPDPPDQSETPEPEVPEPTPVTVPPTTLPGQVAPNVPAPTIPTRPGTTDPGTVNPDPVTPDTTVPATTEPVTTVPATTVPVTTVPGGGGTCDQDGGVDCPVPGDGAVRALTATAGDAAATAEWAPPDDWHDVIGYAVTVVPVADRTAAIGPIQIAAVAAYTQNGLTNGRHYYFVVQAIGPGNVRGAAVASPQVMPVSDDPGQPRGLTVEVAACGAVELSWSAPDDGFDVAGYRVTLSGTDRANDWLTDLDAATTAVTVPADELEFGGRYAVTVASRSPSGATSPPADGGTVVPYCVPDPPAGVTATPSADGEITVDWSEAAPNGRPVDGYEVTVTGPGGATHEVDATTTSLVVSGLTNGADYTVTVRARNVAGWGNPSPGVAVVPLAAVPGPPRAVSVTYGDASGRVTWQAPAADGWTPTGYRIDVANAASPDVTLFSWTTPGSARAHDATGLTNGTSYVAVVRAIGDVAGDEVLGSAATSDPFRPRTVPEAPAGVVVTSTGDGEARVQWAAPADGGSAITGYVVSTDSVTVPVAAGQTQTTINGLTNGQSYTFAVLARNAEGDGPEAVSDPLVIQSHTPDAPGGATATPGDTSVSVTWTAPAGNGTSIAGYRVENTTTGDAHDVSGTSTTFTGLTNGTGYQFRVRANGANGSQSSWAQVTPAPVVPSGAPGLPTSISATPGDARITLAWQPAAGNGTTIARYEIRGPGVSTQASSSPFDVTGLTNATAYTLEIRAVGANGVPGAWATAPSASPSGSPAAPTGVSATATSPHTATVTWSQTSPTNGTTVNQWRVSTVPATTTQTVGSPTAALTGLDALGSYVVVVVAIGANGLQSADATGALSTPNGALPAALTGLSTFGGAWYAGGTCPNPAQATWDPTPGATSYRVEVEYMGTSSTSSPGWWGSPSVGTWEIRVTPVNMYGEGAAQVGQVRMDDRNELLCP